MMKHGITENYKGLVEVLQTPCRKITSGL